MSIVRNGFRSIALIALCSSAACSGGGGVSSPTPVTNKGADLAQSVGRNHGDTHELVSHIDRSFRPSKRSWLNRAAFDETEREIELARETSTTPSHYFLYVSDTTGGTVDVYQSNLSQPANANQPMIGQIAITYPGGLAVDSSGDLYVVSFYNSAVGSATITEYTTTSMPNPTGVTIEDNNAPEDVTVAANGNIYVANNGIYNSSAGEYQGGNIGVYRTGATTPAKVLTPAANISPQYVVTDAKNNLYVGYFDDNAQENLVGEYAHGLTGPLQPIALSNQAYQPVIDPNGNLLAEDHTTGLVNVYPNGSTTATKSYQLPEVDYGYFAFNYAEGQLYTIDYNAFNGSPVTQFNYSTEAVDNTITGGTSYNYGIVTAPPYAYPPPYVP